MKRFLAGLLAVVLASCSSPEPGPAPEGAAESAAVAFVGATLLPMSDESVLDDHTVIVRGDRIESIGPADEIAVPEDALVIDASGKTLMPGFAEMHGHIPPPSESEAYVEDVLFLYAANGVTTVRGMLGHENQLALRDRVNGSRLPAPTLYLAGPGFSGNAVDGAEDAAERVRAQHAQGWDLIKVFPGLTVEEYDGLADAANELGMPFAGHVPDEVGLAHALAKGQQTFDHIDGYIAYVDGFSEPVSDEALREVVQMTLDADAWIVPTMVVWETLFGAPDLDTLLAHEGLAYLPPDLVGRWTTSRENYLASPEFDREAAETHMANRVRLLRALNEGGAKILFGTDAPQQFNVPGFATFREVRAMEEAGMTPFEILQSGTATVGRYFSDKDTFGTIEPGSRADLILLEANPLEDLDNLSRQAGVMVRGMWMPADEIAERLDAIAAKHAR